jgi:hypothetical protein
MKIFFENLGAFPALRAGNRAFRSNLFCRTTAKKYFRFNPLRVPAVSLFPVIVAADRVHTRACSKTNRVLEQAHNSIRLFVPKGFNTQEPAHAGEFQANLDPQNFLPFIYSKRV